MSTGSTKSALDMTSFVAEVQTSLDGLPSRKFSARGHASRRGAQRLAFACVFGVAREYGLFADAEYEVRYVDLTGVQRKGYLDIGIEEQNHFLGLVFACEIVTDKVLMKDLLKLRDAPMSKRGQRLVMQLNPWVQFPLSAPKAMAQELTDDQAEKILIMRYRYPVRTLLERRQAALWAAEQRRLDAERAMRLSVG